MKLGVNLYGLGREGGADFEKTAARLAAFGYSSVEPLVMLACDRAAMEGQPSLPPSLWQQDELIQRSRWLREQYGMACNSIHFGGLPGEDFSGKVSSMLEIVQATDVRCFVMSRMHRTAEECFRDAELFNRVAEALAPFGAVLCYHNHESELKRTEDGKTLLELFLSLCPLVRLEADLGWVMFAGEDELDFLHQYRNRLDFLHLKDFRPGFSAARREKDIVAVGTGALRLREIVEATQKIGLAENRLIIDQDCSEGDLMEDLNQSIRNVIACAE